MARTRSIKPDFWQSPQITMLSEATALTFIGMWNYCDCHGIHTADPLRLKLEIAAGRPEVTPEVVADRVRELIDQGLVREYVENGEPYWIVTGWAKHQYPWKPHYRYPVPADFGEAPATVGHHPADVRRTSTSNKNKRSNKDTDKDTNKDKRAPPAGGTLGRFKDVTDVYPKHRKKNLTKAREYWARHHCDAIADTIVADVIERQAKDVDWLRGAIPHLATYINQRRWNDPIEEATDEERQGHRRGPESTQDRIKRANPGAFKPKPAATVTSLKPSADDWPEEA